MNLRKLQMFSLFMCELSLLIWNDTYKIMVGCPSCTYPSIHFFRGADSEDHGRFPDEHTSKHSRKNFR